MTRPSNQLDLSHLRRETRTALELAILGLASPDLIDRLAVIAGLLEAIDQLPSDAQPIRVLLPKLLERARTAIDAWKKWQAEHPAKGHA